MENLQSILPKTIPLYTIEAFLSTMYKQHSDAKTYYQKRNTLRDIAVFDTSLVTQGYHSV